MTSFVNDSGEYLDYSGQDFGVSKQVASWHDFKLKGDLSEDFSIPNTAYNRGVLGYYGPAQIDSPAFPSTVFYLVVDGNVMVKGQVVLRDSDDKNIRAFFVSGNSSWFNLLKFNIKDVIFPDSYTVSYKEVSSYSAATEGICFPLVDWGYNGYRRGSAYFARPDRNNVTKPTSQEVFPCIYLHSVLKEVCNYAGIKVVGDVPNDPIFKKMLLTPPGPNMTCSDKIVKKTSVRLGLSADQSPAVNSLLTFDRVFEKGELVRYESGRYYAPFEGTYRIEGKVVFNTPVNTNIEIWKGFAAGGADWNFGLNTPGGSVRTIQSWINLLAGDYVYFYFDLGGGGAPSLDSTTSITIELEKTSVSSWYGACVDSTAPGSPGSAGEGFCLTRIIPSFILPPINATDLIKALCIYFGAYPVYEESSKTLTLNKLDKMPKEDAEDWSEYLVSYKTILQTGVAQNNYIVAAQGKEEPAIDYNVSSKEKFGGGVLNASGVLEEKELFKLPFGGSWDELNKTRLESGTFQPYIKFYNYADSETWPYSGVTNAGQASFTVATGHPFGKGDVVRIYSANDVYSGFGVVTATSATAVICEGVQYISSNSGTLVKQTISAVDGPSRILIARPSSTPADFGYTGSIIYLYSVGREQDDPDAYAGSDLYDTLSTFMGAWFDKPTLNLNIDVHKESLAIDSIGVRTYNITLGELNHSTLKNIYRNPRIEAYFLLPVDVFQRFRFGFVRFTAKELSGYFFVENIDNYMGPNVPVKVNLLYIDGN